MDVDEDEEFTAFVVDCGALLLRTAFLVTGDRGLAEDLVQTALAKAYGSWAKVWPTIRSRTCAGSWSTATSAGGVAC